MGRLLRCSSSYPEMLICVVISVWPFNPLVPNAPFLYPISGGSERVHWERMGLTYRGLGRLQIAHEILQLPVPFTEDFKMLSMDN